MNIEELIEAVSTSTGVEGKAVKKVLDAAFVAIGEKLKTEEAVRIRGFGSLLRKPGKNGGESRIVFREPLTKAEKEARKQKKIAKKGEAPG